MSRHFAVSALGGDRPGIVARLTEVMADEGCNLEDTSMTVLRGRFAMVLLVAGPEELAAADLEHALAAPAAELGMALWVHDVDESVPAAAEGETYSVTVYGADRSGLVSRVSRVLADHQVSIHDLSTRLVGTDDPYYAMLVEVLVPAGADPAALEASLVEVAAELGVRVSVRPSGADIL